MVGPLKNNFVCGFSYLKCIFFQILRCYALSVRPKCTRVLHDDLSLATMAGSYFKITINVNITVFLMSLFLAYDLKKFKCRTGSFEGVGRHERRLFNCKYKNKFGYFDFFSSIVFPPIFHSDLSLLH